MTAFGLRNKKGLWALVSVACVSGLVLATGVTPPDSSPCDSGRRDGAARQRRHARPASDCGGHGGSAFYCHWWVVDYE